MFRVVNDMTAQYSSLEAWGYDRFIAPAVVEMGRTSMDRHLAQIPKGSRVLDVGCGGGRHAAMIGDERPDLEIVGLDLSPGQVARAVTRAERFHGRLTFVEGSALELPFDDDSFDVVTSFASIKHWPDPRQGIEEAVRVLKPGGLLLIVEADRGCRLEDAAAFVDLTKGPKVLKAGVLLPLFRTYVAGRSFDVDEARELMNGLNLEDRSVERVRGTPAWLMTARKSGES